MPVLCCTLGAVQNPVVAFSLGFHTSKATRIQRFHPRKQNKAKENINGHGASWNGPKTQQRWGRDGEENLEPQTGELMIWGSRQGTQWVKRDLQVVRPAAHCKAVL